MNCIKCGKHMTGTADNYTTSVCSECALHDVVYVIIGKHVIPNNDTIVTDADQMVNKRINRLNDEGFRLITNNHWIKGRIGIIKKFLYLITDDEFEQVINNARQQDKPVCAKKCGNTQPSTGEDSICLNCGSSIIQTSFKHQAPTVHDQQEVSC